MDDQLSEYIALFKNRLSAEELAEKVTRRKIIAGLGAGAIGSLVIPIPLNVDERLGESEAKLENLATEIDDSDLTDPQQVGQHYEVVNRDIQSVQSVLRADSVRDGLRVAEAVQGLQEGVSSLPGFEAPAENSQTARRISSLNAALKYYESLRDVLEQAMALRDELRGSELRVLYHDGSISYRPERRYTTENLREAIDGLRASNRQQSVVSRAEPFLPDRESVLRELGEQRTVYKTYIAAQQAYLETGTKVETGLRYHELSKLNDAEEAFTTARNAIRIDIDEDHTEYQLSTPGLSLKAYTRLFEARSRGIRKFTAACDNSKEGSKQRDLLNDGLDHILEARRVVAVR